MQIPNIKVHCNCIFIVPLICLLQMQQWLFWSLRNLKHIWQTDRWLQGRKITSLGLTVQIMHAISSFRLFFASLYAHSSYFIFSYYFHILNNLNSFNRFHAVDAIRIGKTTKYMRQFFRLIILYILSRKKSLLSNKYLGKLNFRLLDSLL